MEASNESAGEPRESLPVGASYVIGFGAATPRNVFIQLTQ